MALQIEHILTEGIAQLSYLIGDDSTGTAAVIDPRPDVEVYVELARKHKLAITHIFETHIHADFVSGARELADRVGSAKVYISDEGGAEYGFAHEPLREGDRFEFGKVILTARFTPGHTPEHMSYIASEKDRPDHPWGVFTGDSLFVNSAGRPDLLGGDRADQLADQLFDTLTNFYLKLDDHVLIHPGHGQGSPCGASIGDRLVSTIGYERRFNPFLQHPQREDFKRYALGTAPPEPTYYKRMKKVNAAGPEVLGRLPVVPGLPARQFKARADQGGVTVIDTRSMLAFGGGHVPGALNIGARPEASVWAGWMLDPGTPILLVLDEDADLTKVVPLFLRTGYGKFAGYLTGGMKAWDNAGLPLATLAQEPVQQLKRQADQVQLIDVRSPDEWKDGHIPHARHKFLPDLKSDSKDLDPDRPVVTYCDSGYRASLAASLLQAKGFKDVRNVPGSWQAWKSAKLPVEMPAEAAEGKE